ncbi:cell wall hydrolase [Oceanobacillus iheyensis]|uniref:cell wall hydrolase n=1 Tax=Oceanobacillus iheyensis TaxID=182710 RepID=UPI00364391BA
MLKNITTIVTGFILLMFAPVVANAAEKEEKIDKDNKLSMHQLINHKSNVEELEMIYIDEETVDMTDKEKDLLERLVHAEAKGEPYEGMVAVAVVVLNRVDSNHFPDTVSEVINQDKQFTPVSNGKINKPAGKESKNAVEEALYTDRSLVTESLYFYNPDTATSRWLDDKVTTEVIGNHVFKD